MREETAMSLVMIDIGGTQYASYASVDEADEILAIDPSRSAAWTLLADDIKGVNLAAATRRLDLLKWDGKRTGGSAQATAFPRTGLTYEDGSAIADDAIPRNLEIACSLLAANIAGQPRQANVRNPTANIRRLQAGPTAVEFATVAQGILETNALEDPAVTAYIRRWLEGAFVVSAPHASGTDERSRLPDYSRARGYS